MTSPPDQRERPPAAPGADQSNVATNYRGNGSRPSAGSPRASADTTDPKSVATWLLNIPDNYHNRGLLPVREIARTFEAGPHTSLAEVIDGGHRVATGKSKSASDLYARAIQSAAMLVVRSGGLVKVGGEDASKWVPANLAATIANGLGPVNPDLIRRTDGNHLLYSGKLHVLFGAPETGKSLVAVIFVTQLLADLSTAALPAKLMGESASATESTEAVAVYIDFEDSDRTYLNRLRAAGADLDLAAERTRYYSAQAALATAGDLEGLATARLVVVDTTNAAMAIEGGDPLSNTDTLQFIERFKVFRRFAPFAAWVFIDHEPISSSAERRQAIGAQAKFAAIDGAQYRLTTTDQPRPGHSGAIHLNVTKDRPGGVRSISADPKPGETAQNQHTATIILEPTTGIGGDEFAATIAAPKAVKPNALRSAVIDELERARGETREAAQWVSGNEMRGRVTGNNDEIDQLMRDLNAEGLTAKKGRGRGFAYRLKAAPKPQAKIAKAEKQRRKRAAKAAMAKVATTENGVDDGTE